MLFPIQACFFYFMFWRKLDSLCSQNGGYANHAAMMFLEITRKGSVRYEFKTSLILLKHIAHLRYRNTTVSQQCCFSIT